MKTLLLIPAFNEEPTLPSLIEASKKFIRDIMVIDDGSEDATTLVSAMAGAMVHRLKTNAGKGEALKTGFAYALDTSYDWVITMNGDGQHAASDIAMFLSMLTGPYDLILGDRMGDGERVPLLQRAANRSSSLIVSLLCGRRIPDSQTGFRAYRAELLRGVALHSSHYDLETEVIIKAARQGFRIGHCRIQVCEGGIRRFRYVKDSLRFLLVVLKSFFWW